MKTILASASPRRRQLLEVLGLSAEVVPAAIDEIPIEGETPSVFARRAAREKAINVAGRFPDRLVLGSDTVVEIDGDILGKPRDPAHAAEMLRLLSGRQHQVHTGVALARNETCRDLVDTSVVSMLAIDEETISWYVATGEPLDKAGAYAIQGIAGVMVAGIEGSPHTVVGLPLHRLPELFSAHGVDLWTLLAHP